MKKYIKLYEQNIINYLFVGLLTYMPFHIFLSQWLGASFGGLTFWKIAKDVLTVLLALFTCLMVLKYADKKLTKNYLPLILLSLSYFFLHVITHLLNNNTSLQVATLATVYNNRFIWFFLVAVASGLLMKRRPSLQSITKLIIGVSVVVSLLGVAQWFLPNDIPTHFGYSTSSGVKANFFINEDPAFPRVFSTIRDPNSLGAFLIVPILLVIYSLRDKKRKYYYLLPSVLALQLVVMYLTFSRAAWGGLMIAVLAYSMLSHRKKVTKLIKIFWPLLIIAALVMSFAIYSVRSTRQFRSIVLKADDKNSAQELDSDQYHLQFIKEGIKGIVDKPLGHGPGTAGIVSIHNGSAGQLTENYYVQIGYEVGLLGLVIFIAIWAVVIRLVMRSRSEIANVVLASAAAYIVMAMAMHLWSNEAVAYTWWGLAGLSLGFSSKKRPKAS